MRKTLLTTMKFLLSLVLLCPIPVFAHLISITATVPFPAKVFSSSTTTATYTVTNLTSKIPLTIVDQSIFPQGVAISSSTCGGLLAPKQSCVINIQLHAPASATTLIGELKEWAKPSADGVKMPITVEVVTQSVQFTVTPSAGTGGVITPGTSQTVKSGSSITFTETPNPGFTFNQFTVDGVPVTPSSSTYTFSNVTANHTISASFSAIPVLSIAVGQNNTGIEPPLIALSQSGGINWSVVSPTSSGFNQNGQFTSAACTGGGDNAVCTAAGTFSPSIGFITTTIDGGNSWNTQDVGFSHPHSVSAVGSISNDSLVLIVAGLGAAASQIITSTDGSTWNSTFTGSAASEFGGSSCTGSGNTAICAAVGSVDSNSAASVIVSTNGAQSFTDLSAQVSTITASLGAVSCTGGSASNVVCVAVSASNALAAVSNDGDAQTWTPTSTLASISGYNSVSCLGSKGNSTCIAAGQISSVSPVLAISNDDGATWEFATFTGTPPPAQGGYTSVSCTGNVCAAVGIDNSDGGIPLLAVSTNSGATWQVKSITGSTPTGSFGAVNCAGYGTNVVCSASGPGPFSFGTPFLAASSDGGVTWAYQTITDVPASAVFAQEAGTGG